MRKLLLIAGLLTLTACNSKTKPTDENYINTLNAYFPDHPDCLLDSSITFPYETSDPMRVKQMDALVEAKMLEVGREPAMKVSRYTLAPAAAHAGKHLCYGYRHVTGIVSSTPPAVTNHFTETNVVYTYKVEDLPVWAKTDEVQAAFPKLAEESSGNATGKATLALTGVGWSVPD